MKLLVIISLASILVPCVMLSNDLVSVKLKATGCEHACDVYVDQKTCPSSITVQGEQVSHQKDGFNIVVIDNNDGKIENKHFRWGDFGKKQIYNFILNIKKSSMIIVVFQKMCGYFDSKWYDFFRHHRDVKLVNLKKTEYYIAVAIMCKYSCPRTREGSIPYFYTGPVTQKEYELSISFLLRTAAAPHGKGVGKFGDKGVSYVTIIAVVAAVALCVALLFICYYYTDSYRRTINERLFAIKHCDQPPDVEGLTIYRPVNQTNNRSINLTNNRSINQINEPLYEELGEVNTTAKPDRKCENLYIEQIDIKNCGRSNGGHTTSRARDELTKAPTQPTAPPLNLYAPLNDKGT